jgi:signal transduction histidine kinase
VRLKTRFRITTWASVAAVLVVSAVLAWAWQDSRQAGLKDDLASALLKESFERGLLRDEYLLLQEPRARAQWEAKTAQLSRLLEQLAGEFGEASEQQLIREMAAYLELSTALFGEVVGSGAEDGLDEGTRARKAEFRRRATSRQLLISHDLNGRARLLSAAASLQVDTTQRRVNLVLVALLGMVLVVTVLNARMAAGVVERRVTLLRDGAEQVAHGNLRHRIAIRGDDELAELGVAFDQMTERVQAARVALEAEVSERRQAEEKAARLNEALTRNVEALAASNRELEAFSYAVSHDLRAPLRSVSGFSQAVLEDYGEKLDATGRKYLVMASDAAREMGQLIDDLLGLSRVARVEMARQPVDLSAVAGVVIEDLRRAEPERQVEVTIAPGLVAQGDPTLLRLAIENLLRNAWKFTSRHPTARITFARATAPSGDAFVVADDGAGFDMAYAEKLFRPFQRLHRSTEFPGTGIGLATVSRILRRHGGAISAQGGVEQGAAFTFTVPRQGGPDA